jgi:hypothetical protein
MKRYARTLCALGLVAAAVPALAAPPPRFDLYPAPTGVAGDWGEPTIGVNWTTERSFANSAGPIPNGGTAMFFGGFGDTALRIIFNDCASPAIADWQATVPLKAAAAPRLAGDPILFTDNVTGRTLVSQLVGLAPSCTTEITDDDGRSFIESSGTGQPASIDHQTYGGGPFAQPLPPNLPYPAPYPHAVYYCSQSIAFANCSLSVDGGLTFGPAVPIYSLATCGGLHGHIKVAPNDGTAYIPNRSCGGTQGLVVSTNNGASWTVKTVTGTNSGPYDPSVAVGSDGTLYMGFTNGGNGVPMAIVSRDRGTTWENKTDLGALANPPVRHSAFPAAVAGDGDRAAVTFFGTPTQGSFQSATFPGAWYLYLAATYDRGKTWMVTNLTPDDPIQRGGICSGTDCRNLLDFYDADVDKQGRILIGYEDGCVGPCVGGGKNTYMAKGAIARQSGGGRMFAAYDTPEPTAPKAPQLTAVADAQAGGIRLSWTVPDHGGAPITGYRVYRQAGGAGPYELIATVNRTSFVDLKAAGGTEYSYRVRAVNAQGEGPYCGDSAPVALPEGDACVLPGVVLAVNEPGTQQAVTEQIDVLRLSVAEPRDQPGKIVFTIKTVGLDPLPPGFMWAVLFRTEADTVASTSFKYVGMTTDGGTPAFVYGGVTTVSEPVVGLGGRVYTRGGLLDPTSTHTPDGTITLVATPQMIGSPQPGQMLRRFRVAVVPTASSLTPTSDALSPEKFRGGWYQLRQASACDTGPANQAPTAQLSGTPLIGGAGLEVSFDASASGDADSGDYVALYTFDFGDGSSPESGYAPAASHVYDTVGEHVARVTVRDSHGVSSQNLAEVVVSIAGGVPDAFTFAPRTGVATNVFVTSEAKTLGGFEGSLPISVGNGQYSLDGGAYTTAAGTVVAGQVLRVRHVSASTPGATVTTPVTVGGYRTEFRSTTTATDGTPDAFSFQAQTGVEPATETLSNVITPSGYNTAIAVIAGPGASYRIDGGAWTTASGTINPGQTLQTKHTSALTGLTYTKTYLKVGGVTGYFTTRTK